MLIKINCDYCKKDFYKKESEIKRTKTNYCSYDCHNKSMVKDKSRKCLFCEKIFDYKDNRDKFCSHSCSAKYSNSKRINSEKKFKICINCNKEFLLSYNKKMFCSNFCNIEYRKKLKIERFLNGELTDKQTRKNTIREYLIKKQNGVCAICKNPPLHNNKKLVFVVDHVDGLFENNNPENLRAVCPNCNSQTDTFSGKNIGKNNTKRHKKYYRD